MSAGQRNRWPAGAVAVLLPAAVLLTVSVGVPVATGGVVRAHQARAQQCRQSQYPRTRNRSNPLDLPTAPGPNPLTGARFFVDGPRHGYAAGAIAQLLGLDPTKFPDDYSWARFKRKLDQGSLRAKLERDPTLAWKVHQYEKIAEEPEEQRFSRGAAGGGPGAIFGQVQKVLCDNMTADPGSIPIITTYFLHQGYCETSQQILANRPTFDRQIDEMVQGIGRRPALMLLELDAIGSSSCMAHNGGLPEWEADMRYEIDQVSALPHTVVYIEGGYSDANRPRYTARVLNAVGVRKIRGFFTNDTHINWTINEIKWANKVSKRTHGANFIVNTANNGHGPKRNPHPVTQGNEQLCNPPGRGLGPPPTTETGFKHVDAFLWTGVPGNSSGTCHGGPPPGTFWPARALDLAAHAQDKLGPGYPSNPY